MATLPSQDNYTAGVTVTAPILNKNIRDALNFLISTPQVQLTQSGSWNVVSNNVPQLVTTWDTAVLNTDSMWSAGQSSRIYANTPGLFQFAIEVHYPASINGATGIVHCGLQVNSGGGAWGAGPGFRVAEDVRPINNSKSPNYGTSTDLIVEQYMNLGDYVEFYTTQSSGSTATVSSGIFNLLCSARWVASA